MCIRDRFKGGLYHDNMPFNKPSYWFVSWYDVSSSPNLALFNHVRKNAKNKQVADNQFLVIAPTLHCSYKRATENTVVGERSVGDARLDYDSMTYGWFDLHLKGAVSYTHLDVYKRQFQLLGEWRNAYGKLPSSLRSRAERIRVCRSK